MTNVDINQIINQLICNLLIFTNHESDVELWLIMLSCFWGPLKLYVKAKTAQFFKFLAFVGIPYSHEL